jgi:hypothetical protein
MQNRREFLQQASLLSATFLASFSEAVAKPNPIILLVSGWQDETLSR